MRRDNFIIKLFKFEYIFRFFRKWKSNKSSVCIMDLPEEIWLLIFKNLDTAELRNNIRLVCQDWFRVVGDASLYAHPVIDFRISNPETVFIFRKYRKSIAYVDIRHRQQIVQLLELISECDNLRILRFDYCLKCESLKANSVTELFSKCNNLSKIVIMFELTETKIHRIAVMEMIFLRFTSTFTVNIYTKEGWKKNAQDASVNVHVKDHKEKLPNICLKNFTTILANEIFGLPRSKRFFCKKISSAPKIRSM